MKAAIVYEDDQIIAFDDINPQAPVHVVIVPKRHITTASGARMEGAEALGRLTAAANKVARLKGVDGSGYRLVTNCGKDAGQEVPHIHTHLLGGRKFAWPPG